MKEIHIQRKYSYYLWRNFLVQIFLLAVGIEKSSGNSEDLIIDEIKRRKYKILVIDDERDFRAEFCRDLKEIYGAVVVDVNSGEKGIEELKTGSGFNFIFIDLFMPKMNGIETYFEVRKDAPETPVIIMSCDTETAEWDGSQHLPGVITMRKAEDQDQLIQILFDNKRAYDKQKDLNN